MDTKSESADLKATKEKARTRREPSYSNQFVLVGIIVLLAAILVMILAKFTALKTLIWLN